jgi:hypothetical protein
MPIPVLALRRGMRALAKPFRTAISQGKLGETVEGLAMLVGDLLYGSEPWGPGLVPNTARLAPTDLNQVEEI